MSATVLAQFVNPAIIYCLQSLRKILGGYKVNPLNVELNPICHFLTLLGARHILYVSRIRVNPYIRSSPYSLRWQDKG